MENTKKKCCFWHLQCNYGDRNETYGNESSCTSGMPDFEHGASSETVQAPSLENLTWLFKILPWCDNYCVAVIAPCKITMPRFIFTISIENADISAEIWESNSSASEEQSQHCRQAGAWTCPPLALGIPMRYGAGVSEMARFTFQKFGFSARNTYIFFLHRRQTLLMGCNSSRPACNAVSALPGGLMDVIALPALTCESLF